VQETGHRFRNNPASIIPTEKVRAPLQQRNDLAYCSALFV